MFQHGGVCKLCKRWVEFTKRFRDCVCRDQDDEVDDPMLKFSFDEHIFVGEHQHEAVCKEGAAFKV